MTNIKKLKTIAGSFINSLPIGEDWYEDRLAICSVCPKNTDSLDKMSTELRLTTKIVCPETRACSACGCCIDRKAAVKSETCGLIELGEKPKWSAIEIESKKDSLLIVENLNLGEVSMELNDLHQYEVVAETKSPTIKFSFKLSRGKSITVREVVKTCSCTSSNVDENEDGTATVSFTISTNGFRQGIQTTKTVVVKYIVNNQPRDVEFKAKITKL